MDQRPASISEKEARIHGQLLHELRFEPAVKTGQPILPRIVEKVMEYRTNRVTFGANLDNFTNSARSNVINIPTDDLEVFVADENFSKLSKDFSFHQKIQHPAQGIAIIFGE